MVIHIQDGDLEKNTRYNKDDKAFVFGMRSSKGHEPIISKVSKGNGKNAMRTEIGYYAFFGYQWVLCVSVDGTVYNQTSTDYPLPSKNQLLDGDYQQTVKNLEIFQVQ